MGMMGGEWLELFLFALFYTVPLLDSLFPAGRSGAVLFWFKEFKEFKEFNDSKAHAGFCKVCQEDSISRDNLCEIPGTSGHKGLRTRRQQ